MTRLHAKRPLLVELRVINGPFEGGCRLQSGGGAWLACNTSRTRSHPPLQSASEGIGGARGLGNLVRPESRLSIKASHSPKEEEAAV